MGIAGEPFREVWLVDFEFSAPPGERPAVVCLVARELNSGRLIRLWEDEIAQLDRPPYPTDRQSLFVAYYASAELGCHLALGWPLPECVLDLFVEFRVLTNGKELPCGAGLLGALAWFGLDAMSSIEKTEMRDLAIRGGPYTGAEQTALLDYCQSDVDALDELLPAMEKTLDLPRAILRGRYMKAVAAMEHTGVPIDTLILHQLRDQWTTLQAGLINQIDADFGVYEGRTFKQDRFAGYLANNGIHWPQLESGRLDLTDNTFRDMAKSYPQLAPCANSGTPSPRCALKTWQSGGGSKPLPFVSVSCSDRSESTKQHPIYLRPIGVASRPDQTQTGLRFSVRRLVTTGIWDRSSTIRR